MRSRLDFRGREGEKENKKFESERDSKKGVSLSEVRVRECESQRVRQRGVRS